MFFVKVIYHFFGKEKEINLKFSRVAKRIIIKFSKVKIKILSEKI